MTLARSWSIAADGTVRRHDEDAVLVQVVGRSAVGRAYRGRRRLSYVLDLLDVGVEVESLGAPSGEVAWLACAVGLDRAAYAWDLRGLAAVLLDPSADPRLLDLLCRVAGLSSRPSTPAQFLATITATSKDGLVRRVREARGHDALGVAASAVAEYLNGPDAMTGADGGAVTCGHHLLAATSSIAVEAPRTPRADEHRRTRLAAVIQRALEVDTFGEPQDSPQARTRTRRRVNYDAWTTTNAARHLDDDDPVAEQAVERVDVLARLAELPAEQYSAVVLRLRGLSFNQIGGELGISRSAAWRRWRKAVKRIFGTDATKASLVPLYEVRDHHEEQETA